jgi:hypothetical protein
LLSNDAMATGECNARSARISYRQMHSQICTHLPDVREIVAGNVTFCFVVTSCFDHTFLQQSSSCVLAKPIMRSRKTAIPAW